MRSKDGAASERGCLPLLYPSIFSNHKPATVSYSFPMKNPFSSRFFSVVFTSPPTVEVNNSTSNSNWDHWTQSHPVEVPPLKSYLLIFIINFDIYATSTEIQITSSQARPFTRLTSV